MLTKKQLNELQEEIQTCKNPLIFFDDDPDGLCSFLLLYKKIGQGKGTPLKIPNEVGPEFVRKVNEYNPDKVFILDRPKVSQDFIDQVKQPIIWVDHHSPVKRNKIKYFNPRLNDPDKNFPTSYICYKATNENLWLSMIGCTADWVVHPDIKQVKKQYKDLLKNIKDPERLLFESEFGKLAKIFSFCLKGPIEDVKKCIATLMKINDPYEILKNETPKAKLINKHFLKINNEYEFLLNQAKKSIKDNFLIFTYSYNHISLSQDLSNELLYLYPDKIIIIGRERNDDLKLSLRSKHHKINKVLEKALEGIEGYGGGHEHACGANVKKAQFNQFLDQFKAQLG